MSPVEYLRWLMIPDRSRWKPMLMGLALFAAVVGAAATLQPSKLTEAVLLVLGLAAWIVGASSAVGYVRWFFTSELSQARRDKVDAVKRENK